MQRVLAPGSGATSMLPPPSPSQSKRQANHASTQSKDLQENGKENVYCPKPMNATVQASGGGINTLEPPHPNVTSSFNKTITAPSTSPYRHPYSPNPTPISSAATATKSNNHSSSSASSKSTSSSSSSSSSRGSRGGTEARTRMEAGPITATSYTSVLSSPRLGNYSLSTSTASSNGPLPTSNAFSRPMPPMTSYTQVYHRPTGQHQQQQQQQQQVKLEPTMSQLLAEQPTGVSAYASRMMLDRDTTMGHATGLVSWRKGQGFKEWEKVRLASPEVKRKADVAQLFFYDHYFDLLTYLHARKKRLATFRESVASRSLSSQQAQSEWTSYSGRERVLLRKRRTKLQLDQFHILTQVGQGGYGEVYLAKHKETHQVVALKKLKKRTLLKMDEIRHVLTERDILASTNSPWLVRLLYAFQDPTYVYLAMDFIAGGDFRTLLNNSGVLKEEHARFYIAEMFSSVAELHKLGYIHRDLKPENFLIDPSGHIKLTDFGLAAGALNPGKIENLKHKLDDVKEQDLIYRTTVEMKSIYKSIRMADPRYADSVVGSPDYMAIETLRGQSYTFSVDYWSLGCILFEFLAGFPPFSGATAEETWANLKNWSKTLRRPHYDRPEDRIFNFSDSGWSAITALITSKEKRLSTLDQVKAHPFFNGIDWSSLRERTAPFIPALDSEVDSGYFDDFTSEADMAKYAEVRAKQQNVDKVKEKEEKFGRGVWVGFTFKVKDPQKQLLEAMQAVELEGEEELITLF